MIENYYLRPNFIYSKKKNIYCKYCEILLLDKNKNFVTKDLFNYSEVCKCKQNYNLFNKYKKIKERLNNISSNKILFQRFKRKNPLIMGILNITKDSFFDGGKYLKFKDAMKKAEELITEGADIIDVGGESTKPGVSPVDPNEEIRRVMPVIKELVKNNIKVSCDTRNSSTMKKVLDNGISIINDVSGLNYDKKTPFILKEFDCLYILTHSKGTPLTMQNNPVYNNVVCDIYSFFKERLLILKKMKVSKNRIILDPGIGFGKKDNHNFEILKNLGIFKDIGLPLLIGISRKSFIKRFVKEENLLNPSIVLALNAFIKGANILRVHDVKKTIDAINIFNEAS